MDRVKIPSEDKESTEWHIFTPGEEQTYLKMASASLSDIATIMLCQGCRPCPGEVMNLPRTEVDWKNRKFRIVSQAKRSGKSAIRTLLMTKQTQPIFERQMQTAGPWLFPSPKKPGSPLTTIQKANERVERLLGFHCRPYDTRHTFATRFALRGGRFPVLAKILGMQTLPF